MRVQTKLAAHIAYDSMETLVPICREVKRPETGTDHSLPPSTEVKNDWSYTSIPPTLFHCVHTNNANFTTDVQAKCY